MKRVFWNLRLLFWLYHYKYHKWWTKRILKLSFDKCWDGYYEAGCKPKESAQEDKTYV